MSDTNDDSRALIDRVSEAFQLETPLHIVGGNSKKHLGESVVSSLSDTVSTLQHSGVVSYEPTELVVTVRAGTPLVELVETLSQAGQMLPFEPPVHPQCTIGGVLACALAGASRPFYGSARDYVLGTRVINGRGQDLSFGGEVMKNVAGYDVSRLQVGAWGTLGLLLETSMKVLPMPEWEITLRQEWKPDDCSAFAPLLRQPLPLSGAMLIDSECYLRLSGSESAVKAAASQLGGEQIDEAGDLWTSVANQTHDFFNKIADASAEKASIWRISVADHLPPLNITGHWLYDWAGAQRWLITNEKAQAIYSAVGAVSGHASRYGVHSAGAASPAFQPLTGSMKRLQSRVRDSFDPKRIFNRGRFHPELDEQSTRQERLEA